MRNHKTALIHVENIVSDSDRERRIFIILQPSKTRNSPMAHQPTDALDVSQGHQTWYHSMC